MTVLSPQPPLKFEPGTPPIAQVIAFGAVIDFINSLDRQFLASHVLDLRHYALNKLNEFDGIRLFGNPSFVAPIISFEHESVHA